MYRFRGISNVSFLRPQLLPRLKNNFYYLDLFSALLYLRILINVYRKYTYLYAYIVLFFYLGVHLDIKTKTSIQLYVLRFEKHWNRLLATGARVSAVCCKRLLCRKETKCDILPRSAICRRSVTQIRVTAAKAAG